MMNQSEIDSKKEGSPKEPKDPLKETQNILSVKKKSSKAKKVDPELLR